MVLGKRPLTVGNNKRFTVNYSRWIPEGVTIADKSVTASSAAVTISGILAKDHHLSFFVSGGALNETFTVTVQITDTVGQIKNDTIEFVVVAP